MYKYQDGLKERMKEKRKEVKVIYLYIRVGQRKE